MRRHDDKPQLTPNPQSWLPAKDKDIILKKSAPVVKTKTSPKTAAPLNTFVKPAAAPSSGSKSQLRHNNKP